MLGLELFMQEEPPQAEDKFTEDLYLTIARRIANGEAGDYIYCLQDGKYYFYENGLWREISLIEMLDKTSNKILNSKGRKLMTKFDIGNREKIIKNFRILKYLPLSSFNAMPLINFENYMFDPVGINVLGHKKEYYSTIRIPYIYDEKASCGLWLKTIDEILEGNKDKLDLLQEFMGYCLTRDTRMEKALLLLGESRSGKSTIVNTLQHMVGTANCSHVPLMNLENPQYTSMMIGKLVNIDGEVSKKAEDFEAQFKTIVTGHEVNCNDKFMPPFKFRPFCKMVMSANSFPRITDHSSAFYKRLLLIPCDRVFESHEQDRNLRDKLLEELPGILNWSIQGLKRLSKRGQFEENEFTRNAIEELENENNPVNLFFEEHIEESFDSNIEKGDLYKYYKDWCEVSKNYILTAARFSSCVFKKYHKLTPKDTRLPGNGKRVWRNLKYVNFKTNNEHHIDWKEEAYNGK